MVGFKKTYVIKLTTLSGKVHATLRIVLIVVSFSQPAPIIAFKCRSLSLRAGLCLLGLPGWSAIWGCMAF